MQENLKQPAGWKPNRRTVLGTAASAVTLALAGCGGGGGGGTAALAPLAPVVPATDPLVPLTIIESFLSQQVAQVGGATTAVELYTNPAGDWLLYSIGNRFATTRIGMAKGPVTQLGGLPGAIRSITVVPGQPRALVAMEDKGIAIVDITNPAAPAYMRSVSVGYTTPAIEFADGGGNFLVEPSTTFTNGSITHVLVYNDGTTDQVLIANASFGIQKTTLAKLLATADGAGVPIDSGVWTLKYAGENPWGGPQHLKMRNGRLYAALGFLGLGIYDPATLARTGAYNLYADPTTREDWFGFQNEKAVDLLAAPFIDADGMPTWQQAQLELQNKQGNALAAYPWARFDRYGKYYYNARKLDVVDLPGGRTMAYIAYGLGGLVAVDVTAAPAYAGYVPAAPAHGPDEPTSSQGQSILSHHGSGMLEEGGVADVRVAADPGGTTFKAYFSEHFAGLVVVSGAENPGTLWRNAGAPFDNDTLPQDYWPDYEFVTSYDMTPVPVGEESMPRFLVASNGNYPAPVLLATGEINGHGGALILMPTRDVAAAGQVDLVQSSGAGGVSFIDIKDLTTAGVATENRFAVPARFASTNEVGAAPAGQPTDVAIGHTEGLAVMGNHLFVADGPHGMSVWRIADANGTPTDDLHLVANTLMDEYPTAGFIPTPHAFGVGFGSDPTKAYVLCQSLGLRRVNVAGVGAAQAGAPLLLAVAPTDIYEHSTESFGSIGGAQIHGQDHAYGVAFHGKYAIVADGGNGLTVYDVSIPADPATGAYVVANLGGVDSGKAPLGRSSAVKLWTEVATGKIYAIVSAGPYGVSVVDMTGLLVNGVAPGMTLIKTFEPIKLEEEDGEVHVGTADGKAVDVQIAGDVAFISYDSFGLVAYRMADLIQPLAQVLGGACAGVDPTAVFRANSGLDCRPAAVARYKLQADPAHPELAALAGGAMYMTVQHFPANRALRDGAGNVYMLSTARTLLYVAYGAAGVIKLDWSDMARPVLLQRQDTIGKAVGTAVANGRVYVADYAGGFTAFR